MTTVKLMNDFDILRSAKVIFGLMTSPTDGISDIFHCHSNFITMTTTIIYLSSCHENPPITEAR